MVHAAVNHASSVDGEEIAHFAALADEWWNPAGGLAPLHALNPTRLEFIRDHLAGHLGRDALAERPLDGARLLDVGCGGGLLCEPLARLGATVVGIDAAAESIAVANRHAEQSGLAIDYRHTTAEALAASRESFDAVITMEVIEHVADVDGFVAACGALARPGGLVMAATINRTPKSFALAIVGAEYVFRWLAPGTHDWRKFVRPAELARSLRANGVTVTAMAGASYSPLNDTWSLSRDLSVNYMVVGVKDAAR